MSKNINKNSSFWKKVEENYDEVKKWPKWKQRYIITSEAAKTGRYIQEGY